MSKMSASEMDNYCRQNLITLTEKMKNIIWMMRNTQHLIMSLEYRMDSFGDLGRLQKSIVYWVTEIKAQRILQRKAFLDYNLWSQWTKWEIWKGENKNIDLEIKKPTVAKSRLKGKLKGRTTRLEAVREQCWELGHVARAVPGERSKSQVRGK